MWMHGDHGLRWDRVGSVKINENKSLSYNGVHIQSSMLFMRSIKKVGVRSKLAQEQWPNS